MHTLLRTALLEVPPATAYGVVLDVVRYPEFLPGCESVSVLEAFDDGLVAEVAVAGRGIRETFVTANTHQENETIVMSLRDGPFDVLEGQWRFTPLGELGCKVDLQIQYAPRGILARLLSGFADKIANRMVDAFSDRIVAVHAGNGTS